MKNSVFVGYMLLCLAAAPTFAEVKPFEAHTLPSERNKLAFGQPGLIGKVLVKEGDLVTVGQPLVVLDDRQERAILDAMNIEAKSKLKVAAAQADLELKKLELARKEDIVKRGAGSEAEVQEARVAVTVREIQVQLEDETHQTKQKEAERQHIKVEQMTILSPIEGYVEKLDVDVGESPEQGKPSITVVKNTPLWVNVNLPSAIAATLQKDQQLDVRYRLSGEMMKGKVILLSPVADAASETRLVRLEVENPAKLPAGLPVDVLVEAGALKSGSGGQSVGAAH